MRNKRCALDSKYIKNASSQLTHQLLNLPEMQASKKVALYISHENEIDTSYLMQALNDKQVALFLPMMSGATLEFYRYTPDDVLKKASNGISQPIANAQQRINLAALDLMCLPLVAFDQQCYRLGRGGGFYDRALGKMLADSEARPCLVGLAYDFQCIDQVPTEPWDVPLDIVVTESSVYHRCG